MRGVRVHVVVIEDAAGGGRGGAELVVATQDEGGAHFQGRRGELVEDEVGFHGEEFSLGRRAGGLDSREGGRGGVGKVLEGIRGGIAVAEDGPSEDFSEGVEQGKAAVVVGGRSVIVDEEQLFGCVGP